MSPDLLPAIAAFARVAHHASFTRAAAELGVSPSALSQTVRTLEKKLGVRLLERTTRRVGLTELGQQFLADARPGLAALDHAVNGLDDARDRPTGLLRLNFSRSAADALLMPYVAEFSALYPDITLDIHCSNRFVDLVGGGFDAGVRVGQNLAQDVVAVPLGRPMRVVMVASPAYLRAHAAPEAPADLATHRCLNLRFTDGSLYPWEFLEDGQSFEILQHSAMVSNDADLMLAAARAGLGITCALEPVVREDFEAGRLVPVLERWWSTFPGFYLYHLSRVHMPRKLRVFIDFLQARHRDG